MNISELVGKNLEDIDAFIVWEPIMRPVKMMLKESKGIEYYLFQTENDEFFYCFFQTTDQKIIKTCLIHEFIFALGELINEG